MIRTKRNTHIIEIGIMVIMASLLLASCGSKNQNAGESGDFTDKAPISMSTSTLTVAFELGYWVEKTSLICEAEYLGHSDPFMVMPVSGNVATVFTDYYFKLNRELKGQAKFEDISDYGEDILVVRQKGGRVGNVETQNGDEASFAEGSTYLLFLYDVENGAECNTAGNHYYLFGNEQGSWIDDGATCSNKAIGLVISVDEVNEAISSAADTPSTQGVNKEQYWQEIEDAYKDGKIPQDAYDSAIKKKEIEDNNFATIASAEDVKEYENQILSASN